MSNFVCDGTCAGNELGDCNHGDYNDGLVHIGDVVRFKATGMVATVARFAHDGTTDFWADNETGPYKQSDVERLRVG